MLLRRYYVLLGLSWIDASSKSCEQFASTASRISTGVPARVRTPRPTTPTIWTPRRPGTAACSAAKEAVRGLTKSAAAEWGPLGITISVVAPIGFSDAFGAWYEDLSEEEKARYIEGVPLRRIGDAETDIGSSR